MRLPSPTIAFAFLIGLQSAIALPTADGERGDGNRNRNRVGNANDNGNGNGNNQQAQLAQLLRGTGLRGINANQLNALLQNMNAMGITLGCENQAGGGGNETEAGAGAGAGGEAGGVEEGEGSKSLHTNDTYLYLGCTLTWDR